MNLVIENQHSAKIEDQIVNWVDIIVKVKILLVDKKIIHLHKNMFFKLIVLM